MTNVGSGLIIDDKKILLIKRGNYTKTFPGFWAFPGGRGEEGESLEQIVTREVKEEVGLDFIPEKLFHASLYKDRMLNRFTGSWSGEIKIQTEEIADYKWYSYNEAVKLELAFDCKEVIEKLHEEGLL